MYMLCGAHCKLLENKADRHHGPKSDSTQNKSFAFTIRTVCSWEREKKVLLQAC
jgi:hypothetical protein